jgi:hypothetical protein
MTKFIVTEIIHYHVEADNIDDAIDILVNDEDRDTNYQLEVEERYAIEDEGED